MALRYGFGKDKNWGIDPCGDYASPWILARDTKMNNDGFGLENSSTYLLHGRYGVRASPHAPLIRDIDDNPVGIRYSRDYRGDYYMDPQGEYEKTSPHIEEAKRAMNVKVSDIDAFKKIEH